MFAKIKKIKLTTWILIALILGIAVGYWLPGYVEYIKPFRSLFINAIKCIIAPLIFSSIVVGINSAGNTKSLGRTGAKAIIYFEVATTIALFTGLFFVNLFRPGDGLTMIHTTTTAITEAAATKLTFGAFVEHLLPHNFIEAVAKGDVLQIVLFSCIFGVALMLSKEKGKAVLSVCESLSHIMFKFTDLVMILAPIGVGAATAASVAEHGLGVIGPMMKLVGTLYFALIVFAIVVLWPALIYSRVNIKAFFKELRPTILLAFFTTSSESAYPAALESLEKMGVKNKIASFVLPLGYSFNLDGSTLYLAIASVFVAQAAGIELTWATQITMMLTLMLTTKGVAAVPRASLVVLSGTLTAFGLPLEGIALILGVDEFMDMARTSINLLGNCVATTVVSKWEGESLSPEFRA